MKYFRFLLLLAFALSSFATSTSLTAVEEPSTCCLRRRDFEIVEEFLNSKRTISLEEKACNLTIAGEVRFVWNHLTEREGCVELRGGPVTPFIDLERSATAKLPVSKNEFQSEFDLFFDYVCDRAWGVAWMQFLNQAGVERRIGQCARDPDGCSGSGFCDGICMRKAYVGYNVWCDGGSRFDVEVGRRPLWTIFDSYIQFNERFDGLLLKFSTEFDCWADWYVNAGGFVIDQRVNHFGYVIETGLLDICETGFEFKYSFINWPKGGRGINRCGIHNPRGWQFRNSQWTVAYNVCPEWCGGFPARVYGAFLVNHDAKRIKETIDDKEVNLGKGNTGWYIGFFIGDVRLEGDWSIDITYEHVDAQAIPECDISGIGLGNVQCESFTLDRKGNTNFKGLRIEALYAFTDNFVFDTIVEFAQTANRRISGQHSFSRLELAAIYAF